MRMTLQPDLAELAPGDEVEFHVAMANDGSDPVEVELELQGLDTDLWALSNPIPVIDAGTVGRTTIRVRMPDDATPGERRISVSIRDASGSVGASAAAALRVGSNDVVAIETDPASVSGRKGARLDTIVRNRGDDSLRLRVAGHSDGATVEIRPAEFDLPSGKGARLKAKITPTSRAWFRERRHGVVLDVRGGTIPATTSAIYVQKPTVPPVFLRALAVLLALAVWAGATLVLFQRMSSTPEEVATGEVTDVVDGDTTPPDVLLAGDVEEEDEGVAPPVVVAGTIDGPRELAGTRVLIERVSFGDEGTTDGSTGKVAALTPVALTSGTVLDKVETVTDEKGRFRVASGLIIGAFYRVTAARSGFDLRSQVVRTSEDALEIELAMTLVPGQGAMTGRVVDGDGNPVGGANIVATQGAVTYRTTTASTGDAIGTWTIDGLATPFTYLVTVASAGFASQQLTVEVDGGASVSGVDATVIRDRGTIRGRITYRDSGVGAVTVALDGEVSRTTTTLTTGDLTGSFDFPNLPYGTYLLTFTAPGWLESSREVTVAAGDVPIDVKDLLPSTAVIQGVVAQQVEAGGCDYPDPTQDAGAVDVGSCGGVGVTVTGENGTWSTTTATGDGSFRLSGIPAGEYTVEFARYGYLPEFYRVVVGAGDVLTLPDDATYDVEMAAYVGPRNRILEPLDTESVQMRLVPTIPLDAAEVTATVRDVTAIDTDFDQLLDTEGGRYFTDWTDGCRGDRVDVTVIGQPEVVCLLEPRGRFSLLGVAPGAAEIVVNAPGFGTSTSTIQVSPEGETQMGLIALTPLASLVLNVTGTGDVPVDGATVFVSPTDPDTPLFKGAAAVRDCTVTRADANDIWQERSTIPDGHDSMKGMCADADSAGDISFARGLGTGSFEVILPVNGSDPTDPVALAGPVPLDHRQLTRAIDVQVGESARLDLRLRRYASIVGSFEIPDIDGEGFSDLTKLEGLDAFPAMGSGDDVNGDTTARGVEFCEVDPDADECLPYDQVFVTPRFSFGKAAGLSDGQFRIDRIPPNEGQTLRDYRLRVFSDDGDVEKSTDRGDAISGLAFGEERSLNLVVSPLPRDVSFDVIWMNGAVETVIETAIARVTGVAGFRTIDVLPFREELVLTCPGPDCDTGVTSEDGFTYEVLPVGRTTSGVDGTFADLGADAKLTVNDVFRTGDLTVEVRAPGFVSRSVAIPVSEASADGGVDVVLVPSPRIVAGRIVISPDPTDELYQGLTATLEPVAGGTALLARVNAPVSGEGFGRYSFPSVTPGSYNLTVSGSGLFGAEAVVNVTPGATAFVADELVIGRQLTLDVAAYECPIDTTCTGAFDRAAPGDHDYVGAATVTLSSRADSSESWVTVSTGATCSDTNASGCTGLGLIRFTGLTADLEYRVGVSRSGYRSPAAREIGSLSAGTTTANLELVSFGTLSGTVRGVIEEGDSVNSRLVGASVTLQHADGTTYPASGVYRTDSTGSFLVPATQQLKPGVYTATISADGYQTTTVSVGDADPSAGDPGIEDAVSYALSSDVVLVAQPATISGRVTDSVTGNAIGGYVLVSVQGESCDAAFADVDPSNGLTQTDECRWILAGESSFSGLVIPPRTTTIVFREYELDAGAWSATDRPTVERSVSSGLGEAVTLNISMQSAIGSITGTIQLQNYAGADTTESNIVTVEIFANDVDLSTGSALSAVTTESSGTFTASEVTTGTYNLKVSAPGYQTLTFLGVLVVANGTATVPTRVLTARVRDVEVAVRSDGSVLSDLIMTLGPPSDFDAPRGQTGTITGVFDATDNVYRFDDVAPGQWSLSSSNGASLNPAHIDLDDRVVSVAVDSDSSGSAPTAAVTESVDFVALSGTISASNWSGESSPPALQGAVVSAGAASDTTDADGDWELFAAVGTADLTMSVTAGGYVTGSISPTSPVPSAGQASGLDLTLVAKPRDLVLSVTSDGSPLSGLSITATPPDSGTDVTVGGGGITDNGDGTYTIADALPGDWTLATTNGATLTPKHLDIIDSDGSGDDLIQVTVPVDTAATGSTAASAYTSTALSFVAVSGTVEGRDHAGGTSSGIVGASVTKDDDSSFNVTTVAGGLWEIRVPSGVSGLGFDVSAGGYGNGTVSSSTPSTVLTAKTRAVSFSVTSDSSPLAGLTVTATPPSGSTGLSTKTATDGGGGSYSFSAMTPGEWTLSTSGGSSLTPIHIDLAASDGITLDVPVDTAASGATATTTYSAGTAVAFGQVSGTVTDSSGAAVDDVTVSVGGTTVDTSDAAGSYDFRMVSGTSRTVSYTGTAGSATQSVTSPDTSADVSLALVSLSLVVRSTDGSALEGVDVRVSSDGGSTYTATQTTDGSGEVSFVEGPGDWLVDIVDGDGSDDGLITVTVGGTPQTLLIDGPQSGTYADLAPRTISLTGPTGTQSIYLQKLDKSVTATARVSTDAAVSGVVGAVVTATSGSVTLTSDSGASGAVSLTVSSDREWTVEFDYTDETPDPDVEYSTSTRTIAVGASGGALGVVNIAKGSRNVTGTLTGPSGRTVTITASARGYAATSSTVDIDLDTASYSLTGLSTDVTWRLDFSVTVGTPVTVTRWIGPGSDDITMNQAVGADAIGSIRVVVVDTAETAARTGSLTVGLELVESTTPGASTTTTLPLARSVEGGSVSTTLTLVAGQSSDSHTFANLIKSSASTDGLLDGRFRVTVTPSDGYSVDVGASATLTGLDPDDQTLLVRLDPDTRNVTATLFDSKGTTSDGDDTALGNRTVTLTRTIDGEVNTITATADGSTTNLYTFSGVLPGTWSLTTPGFSSVPILVPVETADPATPSAAGTLRLLSSTDRLDASRVTASPTSVAVSGTSTITVQLADGNGNLAASGGQVRLFTDLGTIDTVTDINNGTYTARFTAPTTIGTATITASLDGRMLSDTATVEVIAGSADAGESTITLSRASLPADGSSTGTITIRLADANGNPIRTGGATVSFSESSSHLALDTVGGVTDHGDGSYSQTYTAGTTVGTAVISATVGGSAAGSVSVATTQVTDRVRFSEVAVASSTLTAGGSSTTVTVTLKSGASTALSESAGTVALFSSAGSFGVVSDAEDGTYTASFAPPTTAGRYVIWATLDGLTLSRTAVVTVEAGAAVASTSSVSADRFSLPADGTSTGSIIVTLRDAYGNVLDGSADVESVGVAVSGGGSVGASTATKQGNGTYAVTYTAAAAVSTGVVTATLDPSGTPTTIGSLSISNTPVTAIGQYSTLSADAASVQVGGSAVTVSVQLRDGDGAGNNTSSAGVFALYSSGGSISVTSNSLSSNGALEASFTPPSSTGPVTIWATLDGQALSASTTVTVIPGVASASTSSVTVDRFSLPADGVSTGTIIVTLRDASGNALGGSADSETVAMTVSGGGSVGTATKQGDGTYAATFTAPSTPGVSTITAKLGETTIGTITLSSTQVTDRVRYSTVTSSSDTFTAGGTGPTITVTLKSDASTPLTASGGRVALHSAAGSLGAVTDVGNGTYTATFDPPDTAGDVVVWATLDGLVLEDVAVITVQPAAASAAASSVSVARTVLPADRASSTTVTITVRDVYGNVRTAGGDDGDITLTVTGGGSIGSVNDNGDGTYSATFTSVASVGTSVVAAQINAVSAGSVSVLRTRVSEVTSTSTLSVSSSTTTAGGSTVTATVQLADSGGIITTDVGDVVIRTTAGSVGSTSFLSGIYSAAVTPPTSTGTVLVWATIDGVALSASATITVNPGSASTGASTVTASSTSLSADGSSTSTITVALRDAYANPLTASGGTVVVSVASGSGSVGSVTNNSNGTYTATYTAGYVAGVVRIEATVGGSKIADAAFITLTSGTATAAQTTIDVSDSSFVADGSSTVTVTVRPRDASGNLVTTGSHTIVVSSTAGTIADSGAPTRQEDGSYTVTLTSPTTTGTATVTATLGGVAITDTASVRAVAGSPSTSTSTVSVADDSLTADGSSTTTVTVRLQDANSNPIVIGGATVAVTVTGGGSTGSVTDNRDGSYTATYTAGSSSGSVTISATVGGSSITDTATITLSAAATAPDAPTDLVGTPGVRSVSLTWTAPTSDGGATITDYIVEYSSNSGSNWTTFADGTSASTRATVTGLTDGTEYTFRVSAVNSAGTGTASATETVTPGVPGAPTSFAAADGADGTATLTWSAPSSGGSDIIRYLVSYSSDSGSTWSAEAAAVSGDSLTLADGTYEVRVRAENAAGFGEYATDSVTVTGTPPPPP